MDVNSISVIVPVHNGGEKFEKCLSSLEKAVREKDQIIVVADGESDGSWRMAEERGIRVLKIKIAGGPAKARNLGAAAAAAADSDILFFTDADVTIYPDTLTIIAEAFSREPGLAAAIGSYDDTPYETNFLSQYKNLLHHYVHQNAGSEAFTFWGACGAVRKDVFTQMGGFDEKYRFPSIEDIELGYRLKEKGHKIRLLKNLRVKHLKRWTIGSLLKADIFFRALPWTRLILKHKRLNNDLNLKISERISVAAVFLLMASLFGAIFFPRLLAPALFSMVLLLAMNGDLYLFFKDKRGITFAMMAVFWHWFYFLYGGICFIVGFARFHIEVLKIRKNI